MSSVPSTTTATDDSATRPNVSTPPGGRRGRVRWRRRIIVWGLIALLVVPPVVDVVSDPFGEMSDWYVAAGLENGAAGKYEQATKNFEEALRWSPNNYRVFQGRATVLAEQDKLAEAIEQVDRAIELGGERTDLLLLKMSLHQKLGDHEAAVAAVSKIEERSRKQVASDLVFPDWYALRRMNSLNASAYARAVGNLELSDALQQAEEALKLVPKDEKVGRAMILDTRGFILYRLGRLEPALTDLNEAVQTFGPLLEHNEDNFELAQRRSLDARSFQEAVATQYEGLAVMLYHRALVEQALGDVAKAEADLKRVREIIGREPDETLF